MREAHHVISNAAHATRHAQRLAAERRAAEEAAAAVEKLGLPKFRAKQLANQYYGRFNADVAEMTDLPAGVRADVGEQLFPSLMTPVRTIDTDDHTTRKTLWRLHDGTLLESVLMRYPERNTLCISSQAGCGMACPFCATGQAGLTRNLSTGEIVDQVVASARDLARGEVAGGPGFLRAAVDARVRGELVGGRGHLKAQG